MRPNSASYTSMKKLKNNDEYKADFNAIHLQSTHLVDIFIF